jgi:hypothetical protein
VSVKDSTSPHLTDAPTFAELVQAIREDHPALHKYLPLLEAFLSSEERVPTLLEQLRLSVETTSGAEP